MHRFISHFIFLILLWVAGRAEEKKPLPLFSADRVSDICSVLRGTKFPVKIRSLCEKLGGEDSIRLASFITPVGSPEGYSIYLDVSEDKDDKGVFQLEVSAVRQKGLILDWVCTGAKLLYLREGISFYYADSVRSAEAPNKSSTAQRP